MQGIKERGSGAGDPGQGIRGRGSVAGYQGQGIRDRGSGAGDQEQGIRGRGSGTGDRGQGIGDRYPVSGLKIRLWNIFNPIWFGSWGVKSKQLIFNSQLLRKMLEP